MGKVIPFSKFRAYLLQKQLETGFVPATILDTNVLISLTYEVKATHDEVIEILASQRRVI